LTEREHTGKKIVDCQIIGPAAAGSAGYVASPMNNVNCTSVIAVAAIQWDLLLKIIDDFTLQESNTDLTFKTGMMIFLESHLQSMRKASLTHCHYFVLSTSNRYRMTSA